MKKDIILSGVGGQGIVSVATAIAEAATAAGLYIKQAEVHGMSQRGGDVQSNLRLSTEPVHSDLIALGTADLIISMEPMEALRYLPYLSPDGAVVTSSRPFINIPDYPEEKAIMAELDKLPNVVYADIEELAKSVQNPKGANMILLGMSSRWIGLLSEDDLRGAVRRVFSRKGEAVVESNCRCFDAGLKVK